jgi:hypothetical protein
VSSPHIVSKYPLQHVQFLRHLKHIKPLTKNTVVLHIFKVPFVISRPINANKNLINDVEEYKIHRRRLATDQQKPRKPENTKCSFILKI